MNEAFGRKYGAIQYINIPFKFSNLSAFLSRIDIQIHIEIYEHKTKFTVIWYFSSVMYTRMHLKT